ncbi:hypothetical protein I8751_23860 [Nostocaceae cyanobacterium CENA357]|uniref:Uncharacterized protein n=1 Tax=Atlanticothrix silvestris CENA357 TaxID=1725252 RepID=A0A8J7HHF9_9CYAN|nr:hypothetical protein [Atlanticothrix silvestris]MBH8555327.1 hypothetical protein [Atlanticothrix silvestris CENA357]
MTQESRKPINLSVHESSDPSVIDPNSQQATSEDINDLNDSVHDDANVDINTPEPFDTTNEENIGGQQIITANLSAG